MEFLLVLRYRVFFIDEYEEESYSEHETDAASAEANGTKYTVRSEAHTYS